MDDINNRVERLECATRQLNTDVYGYGKPEGIGLMSRMNTVEQAQQDARHMRRWLAGLILVTCASLVKVAVELLLLL